MAKDYYSYLIFLILHQIGGWLRPLHRGILQQVAPAAYVFTFHIQLEAHGLRAPEMIIMKMPKPKKLYKLNSILLFFDLPTHHPLYSLPLRLHKHRAQRYFLSTYLSHQYQIVIENLFIYSIFNK